MGPDSHIPLGGNTEGRTDTGFQQGIMKARQCRGEWLSVAAVRLG